VIFVYILSFKGVLTVHNPEVAQSPGYNTPEIVQPGSLHGNHYEKTFFHEYLREKKIFSEKYFWGLLKGTIDS